MADLNMYTQISESPKNVIVGPLLHHFSTWLTLMMLINISFL